MPRAPRQIQSEHPWEQSVPEVRQDHSQQYQAGKVNREEPVFSKIALVVIRAIERGHVMRIVEKERERVESNRPSEGVRHAGIADQ